jgi:hypothetical protein
MRTDGVGRATQHVTRVTEPQRQDALPVSHHLFCKTLSAWLCALMGLIWSRACAHLVCTRVNDVCPVSTARRAFQAFTCRVANAEPAVLWGKGRLHEAAAL